MIVAIQIRFEDCDGNWRLISSHDIKADESVRTVTLILEHDQQKLTGVSYLWDQGGNSIEFLLNRVFARELARVFARVLDIDF